MSSTKTNAYAITAAGGCDIFLDSKTLSVFLALKYVLEE